MLTPAQIHRIRTAGMTDAYFSRLYRVSRSHIRQARIGDAYPEHPTPPDMRPRLQGGRRAPSEARLAPEPVPKPTIAQALAGWRPLLTAELS